MRREGPTSEWPERERLVKEIRARQIRDGLVANVAGALFASAFLAFLVPISPERRRELHDLTMLSVVVLAAYLPLVLALGVWWGNRLAAPINRWLLANRPPTDAERCAVLRVPLDQATVSATFWAIAAVLFTAINLGAGPTALINTAVLTLGGVTTAALTYLLAERSMRPVTALALAGAPPTGVSALSVRRRLAVGWILGTGVPLLGIGAVSVTALLDTGVERHDVALAVLLFTAVGYAAGLAILFTTAGSVGDPLVALRSALARVERGDFETRVPVDDGSEIGFVEAGFNSMTSGLRDRERLREAFGTFVDPELTERVLREGTDLAGEEVEVSVLFMDVRGFTTFAESAPAQEVVATLNALYRDVVPAIGAHGGHANKFIGDGLLAVFGAPRRLEAHAASAVAAAIDIARIVGERHAGRLRVGIGVNSGVVVAGTIGGGGRLDFTVIGDVVNTAARVESATRETGDDVLITEATLALLGIDAEGWDERPPVALKGKTRPVRLYAPAPTGAMPPGTPSLTT